MNIAPEDNFGSLYDKLKVAGAALAGRTVAAIAAGTAPNLPQQASTGLRAAPKLNRETGRLDLTRPARELVNVIRGLSPAPAAFLPLPDGRILKVFRARAADFEATEPATAAALAPGTWLSDGRDSLRVATAAGWLYLLDVQLEGKKRLSIPEFLRGFKLV